MSGYTITEIIVWLLLAAVLGFALGWLVRELVQRRQKAPAAQIVVVPVPEPESEPEPAPELEALTGIEAGPHEGSVLPVVGGGPPSPEFTVKVSRGSKIYHAPTSPAYGRTKAAMWFKSSQDAEAAGFRKPKNA